MASGVDAVPVPYAMLSYKGGGQMPAEGDFVFKTAVVL